MISRKLKPFFEELEKRISAALKPHGFNRRRRLTWARTSNWKTEFVSVYEKYYVLLNLWMTLDYKLDGEKYLDVFDQESLSRLCGKRDSGYDYPGILRSHDKCISEIEADLVSTLGWFDQFKT